MTRDGEAMDMLLHPDELRPVVYAQVDDLLARENTRTADLPSEAKAELERVVAAGGLSALKAAVFNTLDRKRCNTDELVAVSEPQEGPDGLVQALHLRRSQRATEAALKEILASPFDVEIRQSRRPSFPVEAYEHKGRRQTMEDESVIVHNVAHDLLGHADPESPDTALFAVFDGHGGSEASLYCKRNLPFEIARSDKFGKDLEACMVEAFHRCDSLFCEKCLREGITSGTTACVGLIRDRALHIAWVGDSQAVLVRGGKAIHLNEPHKPDRKDERKRIEDAGGIVVWYGTWRVNGKLAVSRAIGDVEYKTEVISTPSYDSLTLDGNESFLLLACDGLFDVMTADICADFGNAYLDGNEGRMGGLAKALCHRAYDLNSTDNISCIVVDVRP